MVRQPNRHRVRTNLTIQTTEQRLRSLLCFGGAQGSQHRPMRVNQFYTGGYYVFR